MPRRCTICDHPERQAIDRQLVAGESANRRIAAQYGVTEASLRRHKAEHLTATLLKAQEAAEVAHADDLLDKVRALEKDARRIRDKAEAEGDYKTALSGIRELTRIVELLAKLLGELDERPQVNVLLAPQWLNVRSVLLAALAPYPQARTSVAEALRSIEVSNGNEHRG